MIDVVMVWPWRVNALGVPLVCVAMQCRGMRGLVLSRGRDARGIREAVA